MRDPTGQQGSCQPPALQDVTITTKSLIFPFFGFIVAVTNVLRCWTDIAATSRCVRRHGS